MTSRQATFICHSSQDAAVARRIVLKLEAAGVPCWISSRDINPGDNYQAAIVRAMREARLVVFLFSEASNKSGEVKKELSLASGFGLTLLPLRLASVTPNEALQYELATSQWIDGWPNLDIAMERLLQVIGDVIARQGAAGEDPQVSLPPVAVAPRLTLSDSEMERLRAILAKHLGPIARVLLQRAVSGSATDEELCERLAASVSNPAAKSAVRAATLQFLRSAR